MRKTAVILAVAGLLLSGCTGGSGGGAPDEEPPPQAGAGSPPPIPEGFTQVDAEQVAFAVPGDWRKAPEDSEDPVVMYELAKGRRVVANALVLTEVPQTDDPDMVATAAWAGLMVGGAKADRKPNRPLEIPGAKGALRVDYTYELVEDGTNTGVKMRGTDISIVYGDKSARVIRVAGRQAALPVPTINAIVETISVKG